MGCVDVLSSLEPKDALSLRHRKMKWESSFAKNMAICISMAASLTIYKVIPYSMSEAYF